MRADGAANWHRSKWGLRWHRLLYPTTSPLVSKGDDADMLGDYPIDVVLLATDLEATRDFYRDKIGLELLSDNPNAVTFRCGSTHLAISKSTVGTADQQTQAAWRVKDLDAELDALRGRGVKIEDYDLPGLKTVDGVADIGFARMAWFIDPAKNCLGIMQLK